MKTFLLRSILLQIDLHGRADFGKTHCRWRGLVQGDYIHGRRLKMYNSNKGRSHKHLAGSKREILIYDGISIYLNGE